MRICPTCIGYYMLARIVYIYNEPLMIIIALVLALVGKPTTTWTWLNMLLMLMNFDQKPYGERDKATSLE